MRTYQITVVLTVDAVNERMAQRLVRLVGKDVANGPRRPRCPGAQGVIHADMDLCPRDITPEPARWDGKPGTTRQLLRDTTRQRLREMAFAESVADAVIAQWETDGGAPCGA